MFQEKSLNDIETLLLESARDNSLAVVCSELASDVTSRKSTFLQLVEMLEILLTNPDINKHNVGVEVLASVMELLPTDILSTNELEFISNFFCSQVKKHHFLVSAALKGLTVLVQNVHLSKQSLHHITSTLFNNVIWQTQTQADRRVFYSLLQYVIFNCIEDYKTTSSELLFSVITAVDGERDPRNLLLLFSFLPRLYMSIPLGPLAEDAFEVVSCYFPIDFHSSAAEPGTVTREDLVSALTPCMLAVPDFAPFCISLILEKLQSSMKSAKIDSYNLMIEGCAVWPSECIVPHCESLWLAIKQDTLPPRDTQIAGSATCALQALVGIIPEHTLTSMLSSVIQSCEGFLFDVQLSLFEPSTRLLLAAMQASTTACNIVFPKLLMRFVSLLQVAEEKSQILLLNKLRSFIQTSLFTSFNIASGGEGWDKMLSELVQCMASSPEVQEAAYPSLSLVVGYLDTECRHKLYSCILMHITTHQLTSLRSACIKCLLALTHLYPDEVKSEIVEKIIYEGEEDLALKQNKFEAVCSLAVIEAFHQVLEQHFIRLVSQGSTGISIAISCFRNLLEDEEVHNNTSLIHFLFFVSSLLPTLIGVNTGGDDLQNSAKIIKILVSLQSSSDQNKVVLPLAKCLLQHPNQAQQMVLLEGLMSSLWPKVNILTPEEINSIIIPVALHGSDSHLSYNSSLQLLSSIINKSSDDSVLSLVFRHLENCSLTQATTTVQIYVTKALVFCGHPLMEHWLNKLVDLLDIEEVAQTAADGIHLVLEESQSYLNLQNHCIVKLLYRQRMFHIVVPRLVHSTRKVQHLKAFAYLLQAVPHTVYIDHIKQIMPLLIKSLDMGCERLLLTVLHTLAGLLSTSNSLFEEHVDTFIPRFLHLSRHNQFMQVRIAALSCLCSSLKHSSILLLTHKQQVLAELVYCLDDKKRLVRREAARTRAKWFLLGASTTNI